MWPARDCVPGLLFVRTGSPVDTSPQRPVHLHHRAVIPRRPGRPSPVAGSAGLSRSAHSRQRASCFRGGTAQSSRRGVAPFSHDRARIHGPDRPVRASLPIQPFLTGRAATMSLLTVTLIVPTGIGPPPPLRRSGHPFRPRSGVADLRGTAGATRVQARPSGRSPDRCRPAARCPRRPRAGHPPGHLLRPGPTCRYRPHQGTSAATPAGPSSVSTVPWRRHPVRSPGRRSTRCISPSGPGQPLPAPGRAATMSALEFTPVTPSPALIPPRAQPVRAVIPAVTSGGNIRSTAGVFSGTGPALTPRPTPSRAALARFPVLTGRALATSRPVIPVTGPPLTPLHRPVRTRPVPRPARAGTRHPGAVPPCRSRSAAQPWRPPFPAPPRPGYIRSSRVTAAGKIPAPAPLHTRSRPVSRSRCRDTFSV